MNRTVFFSWQSDRPAREGRNLIERALETAVARIADDLVLEEAAREEQLLVDKDTKGVPGSPPIFQTILNKIDNAAIFVADLTICGSRQGGRPTPNPNVLLEYGWALKSLGYSQILSVMNEAHGAPSFETLPFDLAAFRFPMTYNLPDGSPASARNEARQQLAKQFENALRRVIGSEEYKAKFENRAEEPPFSGTEPRNGRARFRSPVEPLGFVRDIYTQEETAVSLADGPALWLRLMPSRDSGQTWLSEELKAKATALSTVPLVQIRSNIGYLRNEDGCGYYHGHDVDANTVAYVFNSGEVWIINSSPVRSGNYLQFDESSFAASLDYCAVFLDGLGCTRPYRWIVGIEGVRGKNLIIGNGTRSLGPCVADVIEEEGLYAKGAKAAALLVPFFEKVFDKCGARRPSTTS